MLLVHRALAVLPVLFCLAANLHGQIALGDRIRFKLRGASRISGIVATISADSLGLYSEPLREHAVFGRRDIAQLERRLPRPGGPVVGAGMGLALGAGSGVVGALASSVPWRAEAWPTSHRVALRVVVPIRLPR